MSQMNENFESNNAFPRMGEPKDIPVSGTPGASAYQLWLAEGNSGDMAAYWAAMKGEEGKRGPKGEDGKDGTNGVDGRDGISYPPPADGKDGLNGKDGKDGLNGIDGTNGKDAPPPSDYQVSAAVSACLAVNPPPAGKEGPRGPIGPSAVVPLGNITISQTAAIAIAAGIRSLNFSVPGLLKDDNVLVFPSAALPAGYAIHGAIALANGSLQVTLTAPLLAIGATFSIPCRVIALR